MLTTHCQPWARPVIVPVFAFLALVGCFGGAPMNQLPTKSESEYLGSNAKRVWLVKSGASNTDDHIGWVESKYWSRDRADDQVITYVRDIDTDVIGFYFDEDGGTYRYDRNNEPVFLGNHGDVQRRLQIIYGEEGIYRFENRL